MTHKKLDAWKESINLVLDIYKITRTFPKEELYGLAGQIRRSAVSIPSNIAEGCARKHTKETSQFLNVSLGSVAELETQLIIASKLGYTKNIENVFSNLDHIKKLIIGLIKFHSKENK